MSTTSHPLNGAKHLFVSPMGDEAYFYQETMIFKLNGKRGVVSSSNHNGGYQSGLQYIFNHSCGKQQAVLQKSHCPMRGANIVEHYAAIISDLNLPPEVTTGMGTAALIENAAIAERSYHGVKVMAVATAGIDVNGGRAGDKASHNEFTRTSLLKPGTINIFLFIDALLDPGALTRAIITATEAKTAALLELMANSCYSEDLATGSGTDSIIAVCNEDSTTRLYGTGKHVLLGEMIGCTVKEAVTKALANQTGMTPTRQASIEWQSKRYGITKERILKYFAHCHPEQSIEAASQALEDLDRDNTLLSTVAAITHLCDQNRWQIISDQSLLRTASVLLNSSLAESGLQSIDLCRKRAHQTDEACYKRVISDLILSIAHILNHSLR